MKKTLKRVLVFVFCISFSLTVIGEIKLPAIISSNMVLQRNSTIIMWGWANPGERIVITPSWILGGVSVTTASDGTWQVELKTTDSKSPQELKLTSKNSDIVLDNILFGEVWLCSGQSNMEMPMKGYNDQPVFGSQQALLESTNPNLRLFTVAKNSSKTPLGDLEKYTPWQEATPESVSEFSAVAYYFGEQLQKTLGVPVGLIHSSWGGSNIRAWMSKEALSEYESVNMDSLSIQKHANKGPTVMYNAMIAPLMPFEIQGAIWYQGESNIKEPLVYENLLPAMVSDWANRWAKQLFPFYYVQIAPYRYNGNNSINYPRNTAYMRESMERCLDVIPNSGMAVTLDLGSINSIHPPKKKEVADRLLFNALNGTYRMLEFDGHSPRYKIMKVNGSEVIVEFSDAENGLFAYGELIGFEIAGHDRIFYPAKAKILRRTSEVKVSSSKVESPIAVRYAWRNYAEGTLYDASLLPASSFRTDNWDEATVWQGE